MNGPVRVLHLVAQLGGGGSERWIWDIVRLSDPALVRHRVVPLMLDRGDFVYADRLAAAGAYRHSMLRPLVRKLGATAGGTQSPASGKRSRGLLASLWRAGCYARVSAVLPASALAFRPHVLHVHTSDPLIAGLMLHRVFRTPLIHTVPALLSQLEEIDTGWLANVYRQEHRNIALFFTGASRSELQSLGVPDEKIRWIDGVVDVAAVVEAARARGVHRAAVRNAVGAAPDAPIALSVGRLHPSKGHRFSLAALPALLRRHPDLHWIVLGAGPELNALEQEARELGVAGRAHFLGFREDPLPYYAAADIYFRTPVHEAENLCSYQAMAAGVPVIGFDTGVETELLRTSGHGFLVENRSASALAEAASQVLSLPDRGAALGLRGAGYAKAHLDIRRTIEDYAAAYVALGASHAAAAVPARNPS